MDRITAAEVFVEIVDRGSMAAAGQALEMSPAMVTRYLREMETWAGARLLHRTTRRLSLTPPGEQVLARCRAMLEVSAAMAVLGTDEADPVQGMLRVACAPSLAQSALARALPEFLRRHPRAAVDLRVDSRAVNLVEERIDLAIRITNDLDPNLIARRLTDCASVICASPAYLAEHGTPVTPRDLSTHNCLTYSYFGHSLWEFVDTRGEHMEVPVSGRLSANEAQALLCAAEHGAGIALQPRYAARELIAAGRLVALLPGYEPKSLGIHAVFQSNRQMRPVLRALVDFLVEWFARPQ